MPRILAVHASDAYPVLESFRGQLDASSILFLNIEDIPSAERRHRLMEASRDIDICLVFSSDFLLQLLWPLGLSEEGQRIDYLLSNTRTFTIRLDLTRPSKGFSLVWQDLLDVDII
jgi:hypothetical protein